MKVRKLFQGENGDVCRIPSVVTAKDGTVYAFANIRVGTSRDDADVTQVVMSMKRPGGEFTEPKVIAARDDWSCMIGSAVADEISGRVMCFFKKIAVKDNEFRKTYTPEERDRLAREKELRDGDLEGDYVAETCGDGVFGIRRVSIEPMKGSGKATGFLLGNGGFTHGSGSGITVRNGAHAGRLVVPARVCLHPTVTWDDLKTGSSNTVIYSDDCGATWHTGGLVEPGTGEGTLCERNDGSLYYNSRAYFGDSLRRSAVSFDGGESFTQQCVNSDLIEPCCNAAVARAETDNGTVFVFTNPADREERVNMTFSVSFDEGRTWRRSLTVDNRKAAYSSLTYDQKSGMLYLLYECGENTCIDEVDIAEVTLREVLEGIRE